MLKHIRRHSAEADILEYLSDLKLDEGHTIRPVSFWKVDKEAFIPIPVAGYELDATSPRVRYSPLLVVRRLVGGLAYMHKRGVAHLDLKPDNIFVNSTGYLSIIDFSVSSWVSGVDNMTEGFSGTTGYMAPEVGRGLFSPILADV